MNGFAQLLDMGQSQLGGLDIREGLVRLLLALVAGQLTAWMYVYNHSGLSYSRAFDAARLATPRRGGLRRALVPSDTA